MAKNLSKAMPNKATFTFGSTGERQADVTKKIKGKGDLRAMKGLNNGR